MLVYISPSMSKALFETIIPCELYPPLSTYSAEFVSVRSLPARIMQPASDEHGQDWI